MRSATELHRTQQILDLRQRGLSLKEIGTRFNITRQRVCQILGNYDKVNIPTWYNLQQVCRLTRLMRDTVRDLVHKGIIHPEKAHSTRAGCTYYKFSPEVIQIILNRRVCKICGSVLPVGKKAFCSDACAKENGRRKSAAYYKRKTCKIAPQDHLTGIS